MEQKGAKINGLLEGLINELWNQFVRSDQFPFLSFFFQLRKKDPGLLVCVTATFKHSRQLKGTYPEAPGPRPSSTRERLHRQWQREGNRAETETPALLAD